PALVARRDHADPRRQPLRLAPQRRHLDPDDAMAPGVPLGEHRLVAAIRQLLAVVLDRQLADRAQLPRDLGAEPRDPRHQHRVVVELVAEARRLLKERHVERYFVTGFKAPAIRSIAAASSKSFAEIPPASCVVRSTRTVLHTLNHSGWWFIRSATSAALAMKPNASTKSANLYSRCSLPPSSVHPARSASRRVTSPDSSLVLAMPTVYRDRERTAEPAL